MADVIERVQNRMMPPTYEGKPVPEAALVPDVPKAKIGSDEVLKAIEIMRKYKEGKTRLEDKIIRNEEFWKLRQWDGEGDTPSTAWLWSCIQSRYADVMDSYPTCNIKPRQSDDRESAKILSAILPVVLEQNRYEETYSDNGWYALKHGGGVQGIFWDGSKHNSLGDVSIKKIDLLSFFWEPGKTDIQESENIFVTELVNKHIIEQRYPQTEGHLNSNTITVAKYMYDDKVDTDDKAVVVDWYYHTEYGGKKVLQYVKFVNDIVLYASENDPVTAAEGYYHHGKYPFVVTNLYPIEGSIIGYGLTDIAKSTQLQIDVLNQAMTENAIDGVTPRYFSRIEGAVNEEEYADRKKKIVHVQGNIDGAYLRPIDTKPLAGQYINFLQMKQEEIKYATSNQDVNNGQTSSGVTAASAIAALQETAGKASRASNREFYRAYREVCYQVIELIRQFYDVPRTFRLAPDANGEEQFVSFDNSGIKPQAQMLGGVDMGLRLPEFDVDVTAEKASPYKKMEMNELALNFYQLGFFNPETADQALACLEIMDFDHKDLIVSKIQQNQTLQQRLLQFEQLALQLANEVNPVMADQIAQTILMESGQQMPVQSGALVDLEGSPESSQMNNARQRAQETTQV